MHPARPLPGLLAALLLSLAAPTHIYGATDRALADTLAGAAAAIDLCDMRALYRISIAARDYSLEELDRFASLCAIAKERILQTPILEAWHADDHVSRFVVIMHALERAKRMTPALDTAGTLASYRVTLGADMHVNLRFAKTGGSWRFILL